jgi:Tol biopolymer transport system component
VTHVRVAALSVLAAASLLAGAAARAEREPVLKQVDVPHSYYWRELYLPQLTTGPASFAFLPDGAAVIVSASGSLYRQRIDADEAHELTHATGAYDYQPDVAPGGERVVFSRYDGNSIELWSLDLASGRESALTHNGAVNVEPRIAPDGKRLVWVSTARNGRFDLFIAELDGARLVDPRPFFPERRSEIDRYYYSAFDHAINPSWSPDGTRIAFVDNAGVAWGTGDLWSVAVDDPADRVRILREETSWAARPEFAPEGKRILYSSYHGRQSHQLWLTTPSGAPPLPLTFGDFDRRNARWSPDGTRIGYISNESGSTRLMILDVIGGATHAVVAKTRTFLRPQGSLTIDVRDAQGRRMPARVAVLASDGRSHAPADAWMHADDGFDRAVQKMETHYFHCAPPCTLTVPAGRVDVTVQRGPRYRPAFEAVEVSAAQPAAVTATLEQGDLPPAFGNWLSADLHVHMNYGGTYRNTSEHLAEQARAEDLDLVYDLIVNKEERIPDVAQFASPPAGSSDGSTILHAQEYHTSLWGHLGLLNLADHLVPPDFASYRHTALASPYPHNGVVADLAHAQGALVGYVHPFDWEIAPREERSLTNALPADVAHDKVDYLEVVGFSDHKSTAAIWYRLLNLGFRLPAGAGTDAMTNYASLRGPVGLNRVYVETGGDRTPQAVRTALRSGRTFATNAPLLGLDLDGFRPGDTLQRAGRGRIPYRVAMRSPVPVDHVELVLNGKVLRSFKLRGERRLLDAQGTITVGASGWLLLRAWNDSSEPLVFDLYPYATTSPIYLELPKPAPPADDDAAYFVAWLDRVIEAAQARDDYLTESERAATLDYLNAARAKLAAMKVPVEVAK